MTHEVEPEVPNTVLTALHLWMAYAAGVATMIFIVPGAMYAFAAIDFLIHRAH